MTTFDESKINRGDDGKFGPKAHEAVELDLDVTSDFDTDLIASNGRPLGRYEDFDQNLTDRINEGLVINHEDETVNMHYPSVIEAMGFTREEAESAYGTARAQWLSSVTCNPYYHGPPVRGAVVEFMQVDPVSGEEITLDEVHVSRGQLERTPDLVSRCPVNSDGTPVPGAEIPAMFTDEGKAELAPWREHTRIHDRQVHVWKRYGFEPEEAQKWIDMLGHVPAEAERSRRTHGNITAAITNQRLQTAVNDQQNDLVARDVARHRVSIRRKAINQALEENVSHRAAMAAGTSDPDYNWHHHQFVENQRKIQRTQEQITEYEARLDAAEQSYKDSANEVGGLRETYERQKTTYEPGSKE